MAIDVQQLEEEFAQRKMDKNIFSRLWAFTAPYRGRYYFNVVLALIATASALFGPKIIQYAVDRCILMPSMRGLVIAALIYLGNMMLGWGLTIVHTTSVTYFGEKVINDVRMAVFRHIQRLSMNYFDR